MANDIIARLRLSGQQFTADTKSTFSAFNKEAISSAAQAKTAFSSSFNEIQQLARTALQMPRTAGGGLDLNVGGMRAAAASADELATAQRAIALAYERAAAASGDMTTATRLEVAAAQAAALEAEDRARGLNQQVVALERLQTELNQTAVASRGMRQAGNDNTVSLGQQRASALSLGQQFSDFSVQVMSGQSAFLAFGQQAGQAGFALSGFEGKLGTVGKFLTGPWGIALTIALSALGMFVGKLLDGKKALDEAKMGADGLAQAQSVLGGIFDLTTGKLKSQNEMLRLNAQLTAINLRAEAVQERDSSKKVFGKAGSASIGSVLTAAAGDGTDMMGALNKGSAQLDLIRRLQAGKIDSAGAVKEADKLDFSGLKVTKTEFLTAISSSLSAVLKEEMAGKIEKSLTSGVLDPSLRKEPTAKKPKSTAGAESAALGIAKRIADISAQFEEMPTAVAKANAAVRDLDTIIAQLGVRKPPGFKQLIADAETAKKTVQDGLVRPFNDFVKAQEQGLAVSRLVGQGRTVEATALQNILRLQLQQGPLTAEQRARVIDIAFQQERAARAIEDQQRQMGIYIQSARDFQRSFEDFFYTVQTRPGSAIKSLFSNMLGDFRALQARLLSENLFHNFGREVQDMLSGRTGVQQGNDYLAAQTTKAGDALGRLVDSVNRTADALRPGAAMPAASMASIAGSAPLQIDVSDIGADVAAAISDGMGRYGLSQSGNTDEIVVNGIRPANDNGAIKALDANTAAVLTGTETFNLFGAKLAANAGALLKLSPELQKVVSDFGGSLGTMLQGAAFGQMAGGVFGGKSSQLGGAIGGALGSKFGEKVLSKGLSSIAKGLGDFAGPLGGIVGGLLGGALGGLFGKTKKASATLGFSSNGELGVANVAGNSASYKSNASQLGGGVSDSLRNIADALDGDLSGNVSVSIGQRKKKFVVDPTGQGRTKGSGVLKFDDEKAAAEAAVRDAIGDGVIAGISAASQRILRSGQDLDRAITKAASIEAIPKQLKEMLDPVGAAVDAVNEKYTKLVATLNEGGATAEQMAQAQQLYGLELDQVKANTASASQSLKDFLESLKVGSSSPYSLRDQDTTARATLQPFLDQINAGKSIDQGKYQDAAQTFLDIQRQLYGSTSQFFSAMDQIQASTAQAIAKIDNAVPVREAAPDPFAQATANSTQASAEILAQQTLLLQQHGQTLAGILAALATGTGFAGGGSIRAFATAR